MSMNEIRENIPVIALKNVCILPGMMVNFDIKHGIGIAGAQAAMEQEQLAFLVTQKNEKTEHLNTNMTLLQIAQSYVDATTLHDTVVLIHPKDQDGDYYLIRNWSYL